MWNKNPVTILAVASLGLALVALSGCGHSDQPAKAPPPAAADANRHLPKELSDNNSPAVSEETQGDARVKPEQIPNVGAAPAGEVAFGPTAPGTGMDPAGDAEHNAYASIRQKQADDMQKQQQAAVQQVTPAPAHPAPPTKTTKRQ
jgi:hypothetical protein